MPSFSGLLIVTAVAFGAPFLLGLFPRIRLPAVVLEIVAGIVVGPSVLGWVEVDQTIAVVSTLGLAFLLFLAGLEIDFARLRGRVLTLTALGFGVSFAIALVVGLGLQAAGLVDAPLLVAITLVATSLGVLIPVLKDAGESASTLGQLVIAAGSIADFGAIILLSIFFTGEGGTGATLLLIGSLLGLGAVVFLAVRGAERSLRIRADLAAPAGHDRADPRPRRDGAARRLRGDRGVARAGGDPRRVRRRRDPDPARRRRGDDAPAVPAQARGDRLRVLHPGVLRRHRACATTSTRCSASASTVLMVPVFLAALLVVRGLPALLYRRLLGARKAAIAGLLQSTSLPFIVAATAIGLDLGVVDAATVRRADRGRPALGRALPHRGARAAARRATPRFVQKSL